MGSRTTSSERVAGGGSAAAATVAARIERWLSRSKDSVFVRTEFHRFGSYGQVGKVLHALVADGRMVKAGYGIYVKARPSVNTGNPVPVVPLLQLIGQLIGTYPH
jgi:hypothetical protein